MLLVAASSRTQASLVLEALVELDGADAISGRSLTGAKGADRATCRVLGSDSVGEPKDWALNASW